jgi:hypothetical protein
MSVFYFNRIACQAIYQKYNTELSKPWMSGEGWADRGKGWVSPFALFIKDGCH